MKSRLRVYSCVAYPCAGVSADFIVSEIGSRRVAQIALEMQSHPDPIWIGLCGELTVLAPDIAFARRAARQPLAGYLLIDGDFPRTIERDWPDAPVCYLATTPAYEVHARAALDRGWKVTSLAELHTL